MTPQTDGFRGLQLPLNRTSGGRAVWVVHPGAQRIAAHRHDHACLTIPVIGSLTEVGEFGEATLAGPSVIYHPAGGEHEDRIGDDGLETLSISLDPAWLTFLGVEAAPSGSRFWSGGAATLAARRLAKTWRRAEASEADLGAATAAFFFQVLGQPAVTVGAATRASHPRRDLHSARQARAYRAAAGEGVREAARRRQVEQAVLRLRRTGAPLADIAAASGFCDQSHMNRTFRTVVGRTPLAVRREAAALAALAV